MKKILFLVLTIVLISSTIFAKTYNITFGWDRNTEPDLAGYRLYQRDVTGDYSIVADVLSDANTCTINVDLDLNKVYYYAATAYDELNNESDYSNEVMFVTVPDTSPPESPKKFNANCDQCFLDE